MARFYKTAKPRFERGTTFEMPWELMMQGITKKDQDVQGAIAATGTLESATENIQHLSLDKDRAAQIQEEWAQQFDSMTEQIRGDAVNAANYMPQLNQLRRKMQKEKTNGLWGSIENRYNTYNKWLEDNKDKQGTPEFEQVQSMLMNQLHQEVEKNPNANFNAQNVYTKPDLLDKDLQSFYKNAQADAWEEIKGDYKHSYEGIGRQQAQMMALNTLYSRPEFQAYIEQQAKIAQANGASKEEIQKRFGSPLKTEIIDGKEKITGFNPEHAMYNDLSAVTDNIEYSDTGIEMTPDALDARKQARKWMYKKKEEDLGKENMINPIITETKQVFDLEKQLIPAYDKINEIQSISDPKKRKAVKEQYFPGPEGDVKFNKMKTIIDMARTSAGIDKGFSDAFHLAKDEDKKNKYYIKRYRDEQGNLLPKPIKEEVSKEFYDKNRIDDHFWGTIPGELVVEPNKEWERANRLLKENSDKEKAYLEALEDKSGYEIAMVSIGSDPENLTDLDKISIREFNAGIGAGSYQMYNPGFAPYEVAGVGHKEQIHLSTEDSDETDFINDLAAQQGVQPYELFVPSTLRRFERGGRVYYEGMLKEMPETEDAQGSEYLGKKITIGLEKNNAIVSNLIQEQYELNPGKAQETLHVYNYATDNLYADIFDSVELWTENTELQSNQEYIGGPSYSAWDNNSNQEMFQATTEQQYRTTKNFTTPKFDPPKGYDHIPYRFQIKIDKNGYNLYAFDNDKDKKGELVEGPGNTKTDMVETLLRIYKGEWRLE